MLKTLEKFLGDTTPRPCRPVWRTLLSLPGPGGAHQGFPAARAAVGAASPGSPGRAEPLAPGPPGWGVSPPGRRFVSRPVLLRCVKLGLARMWRAVGAGGMYLFI